MRDIIIGYWIIAIVYCLWRVIRRYRMSSHDGITGIHLNEEMLGIIALAPILAPVDIIITWIKRMNVQCYRKKRLKILKKERTGSRFTEEEI